MFTPFRRLLTTVALYFLVHSFVQAQSDVTVAGGDASGNSGFLSFSVGQVSYECVHTPTGILTAGVQQSFEPVQMPTGVSDNPTISFKVFPNPSSDVIYVSWITEKPNEAEIAIYDLYGRELSRESILSNETPILVKQWPAGIYLIKILQGDDELKSIKFIKS